MAKETKAEREAREQQEFLAQQQAEIAEQRKQARLAKAAEKKAAAEAATLVEAKPNVLIIDFSDDVKDLLKSLLVAIGSSQVKIPTATTVVPKIASPVEQAPAVTKAPVEQARVVEKAPVANQVQIGLTQIRELINEKATNGKTNKIVELLKEFGASNASTLDASHYGDFYNKLNLI